MSIEKTLAERGNRYGDFADHARLCQDLKSLMQNFAPASWTTSAQWNHLSDVQKQALEVIADKIARILSGDPNYADNWHDIQGYAKLVEDRLPAVVSQQLTTEPAAAIDDESPRMQTIGQNGEMAEKVYPAIDAAKEPQRARHQCLACGLGHSTHRCGADT
jgi:hypothetical protein